MKPVSTLTPRQLSTFAEALKHLSSVDGVCARYLTAIREIFGAQTAFVSLYDQLQDRLYVATLRGRQSSLALAAHPGEGPIGRAFSEGKERSEGRLRAIPLGKKRALGVLSIVGGKERVAPALLEALTCHLAVSIELALARRSCKAEAQELQRSLAALTEHERQNDVLLGNVSDELKSPLTTIKALLASARLGKLGAPNERGLRGLDAMERNANRLLHLINDLLLTSRLSGAKMSLSSKPVGLRALVKEAAGAALGLNGGIAIPIRIARSGEAFVRGDRDYLMQAFIRLFAGAQQLAARGAVHVSIECEIDVAKVAVIFEAPHLLDSDLPHFFLPLHYTSAPVSSASRGLDLATVGRIAALHGGSASAARCPEGPVRLALRLPLFAGTLPLCEEPFAPARGSILLAEPDPDVRESIAKSLEDEGFVVVSASTHVEAWRRYKAVRPVLLLLDSRLVGTGRHNLVAKIRADSARPPPRIFLGSGQADTAATARSHGLEQLDAYFDKPLELSRLVDAVRRYVEPSHGGETIATG